MTKITPEFLQKFEFYSIFLNNLILLLGVAALGWDLFDTLFLVWLELLAALLVLNYLKLVVPIRYGRPGTVHLDEYRQPALRVIAVSIYALLMHYFVLLFLIQLGNIGSWDTSQGVLMTLVQLPVQLWQKDLLLLSILFMVVYLAPLLLLEKQGIVPKKENLPMSARVMIHRTQFVAQYIWFALLWVLYRYAEIREPVLLVGIILVLKSAYEGWVFFRVKRNATVNG